jgi:hypothetical protein
MKQKKTDNIRRKRGPKAHEIETPQTTPEISPPGPSSPPGRPPPPGEPPERFPRPGEPPTFPWTG